MRRPHWVVAAVLLLTFVACKEDAPVLPSTSTGATVRVVFLGSTVRRSNLPPSAEACIIGVGLTHIHPSWRSFAGIPLQAVPPNHYEITFNDVPIGTRVSFRVNDQNSCDENPTGAVTRNVFANNVRLVQNTTTPGSGEEPGYGLTVAVDGSISQ